MNRNCNFQIELVKKWPILAKCSQFLVIFGAIFPLRDSLFESRETCLANLSLVSRETVRDSATLFATLISSYISTKELISISEGIEDISVLLSKETEPPISGLLSTGPNELYHLPVCFFPLFFRSWVLLMSGKYLFGTGTTLEHKPPSYLTDFLH